MYKIVTLKANAKKIVTVKCIDTKYVQKHHFEGKCKENRYFKMCLTPNVYKIITLTTNAKEIVTWKYFWCQICTKPLL